MPYVSPEKYCKLHPGVGVEEVKRMLRTGELKGHITNNGGKFPHYKIFIDENENTFYTKEFIEELIKKNAQLEEKLRLINSASAL